MFSDLKLNASQWLRTEWVVNVDSQTRSSKKNFCSKHGGKKENFCDINSHLHEKLLIFNE